MIIFRYLARNLIASTLAVTAVLMLVVVSGRFVKYLADAAAGRLDPSVLLALLVYRLPGFFELVLPLAFFISILLVYGQFYVENEMTVLQACGMSHGKLVTYTLSVAALMALVVGAFSLYISPSGYERMDNLIKAQWQRGEIETLSPGKFYSLRANKGVTYAEQITAEGELTNVFLAQSGEKVASEGAVIIVADKGYSRKSQKTGESYLVLKDGQRIQGVPGNADFQVTSFQEFGQRLEPMRVGDLVEVDAIATEALWGTDDPQYRSTLHWRLSLPVMVIIVSLLAVPLSKTNPRRGRFNKILPAVILYVIYLLALNFARGEMEDQNAMAVIFMPLIHSLFLLVAGVFVVAAYGWPGTDKARVK